MAVMPMQVCLKTLVLQQRLAASSKPQAWQSPKTDGLYTMSTAADLAALLAADMGPLRDAGLDASFGAADAGHEPQVQDSARGEATWSAPADLGPLLAADLEPLPDAGLEASFGAAEAGRDAEFGAAADAGREPDFGAAEAGCNVLRVADAGLADGGREGPGDLDLRPFLAFLAASSASLAASSASSFSLLA